MLKNFFQNNKIMSGVLAIVRIYLGYTWLMAGWGKVTGGFDASGYLKNAVANPPLDKATGEPVYGWWVSFLENVAIPNADLFSGLVAYGEVAVGLGLIVGLFTPLALLMGLLMNFAFLFSGTISTNPQMVLIALALLFAGANSYKIGLHNYVVPKLKKILKK